MKSIFNQLGMFVVQSWESQMALSCSRLKSQTSFRSDTTGLVNFPEGNEEIVDTNMCCDLCYFSLPAVYLVEYGKARISMVLQLSY